MSAHDCSKGHAWTRWGWRSVQVPTAIGPQAARGWWRMCRVCRAAFEMDVGKLPPQWWNVLGLYSLAPAAPPPKEEASSSPQVPTT